jgi:autotransporter-associated beta strand protein
VNAGTLALSGSGTLGSTSGTVAIGAGTLDLGGLSRTNGAFTLDSGTLRNGTLIAASYALNNSGTVSAALAGSGALTKSGAGNATLSGANTYSGTTTVNAGTLSVDGSLLNSGSVVVNANGFLGGSGRVGAITGAGTVGPGNSPGILTATSVNPTGGTDFKFEFTALSPTYTSATSSGNDLLHLTASASPFAGGAFTSGNIISIYLNSSSINDSLLAGQNTTFSGGFFVDGAYALAAELSPASFAYYTTMASLGTGPAVNYNGTSYYSLNSEIAAKTTLTDTAVASAGFSTGTVAGTVLTFNAVPEPSAQSLLAFGMAALVAVRSMRRKQS